MVSILAMVHLSFSGTGALKIATFLGLQIGHMTQIAYFGLVCFIWFHFILQQVV